MSLKYFVDESILSNDALDLLVLVGSNIKLSGLRYILPNYDVFIVL